MPMEHVLRLPDGRTVTLEPGGPDGYPYAEKEAPDGDVVTAALLPETPDRNSIYRLRILSPDRTAVMLEAESAYGQVFAGLLAGFWPESPGGGHG